MAETLLNQQEPKLETNTETKGPDKQLKRVIGILLSLVMVGLTAYVLNLQNQNSKILSRSTDIALTASDQASGNYRTYVGRYKETKAELEETTRKLQAVNRQLDQVTAELEQTRGSLSQTQSMLTMAQEENARLKQELQGLDQLRGSENVQNIDQLQDKIAVLKDKDAQVSLQLAQLKDQLHSYQADFSSLSDGKTLISLFRAKINLVKNRMHYLRQQAFLTKMAAQKEKDRLAALNGNDGFLIRNGQLQNPNGTNKSFAINVKIVQ